MLLLSSVSVGAVVSDDSIIDELNNANTKEIERNYKMKNFESCAAFEEVLEWYIQDYWENNYSWGYNVFRSSSSWMPEVMEMSIEQEAIAEPSAPVSADLSSKSMADEMWGGWADFSGTNIQVLGVDEADKVKTDGRYFYYFNETERAVFILVSKWDSTEVIRKIHMPKSFYNVELFVAENRLVIVSAGYSNNNARVKRDSYIDHNSKAYTVVFDTTDIESPELIKLYTSDGSYSKSRRIGDYVYVLSTNYFNYPYWNISNKTDIDLDASELLPQKIDISKTDVAGDQNLTIDGKVLPYSAVSWDVADCDTISYSFPDEETLKNTNFNPGYNIISAINIRNVSEEVSTQVIAGSNNEIYMSTENLYLTEGIYEPYDFRCPADMLCAMPFFWGGTQNTLIHKLNIDNAQIDYQDTGLVPWSPLNQYSMDEHDGNFRIITSQWQPEASTWLYTLDENLKKISDLTNLAPWETFQSSRFLGDKLFLVTFEQIDPLFAIDLSDETEPNVLGELKIPGFSTYLHPYDENHLIGLWYDTEINEWGGTQTAGVKVDLYKMNYDKKCGDSGLTNEQNEKCASGDYKGIIVEQLYSETLWGKGSYSEALNNPRMFVWNSARNTLLLPATLYERDDQWRTTDYYDGLFAIKIDANSGIVLEWKTTHIDIEGVEEKRIEECEKYIGKSENEPVCRELLNWDIHCEEEREYSYIPNYCYKDSDVWQYIGDNAWQYNNMQMKRSLYIGDRVFGFSDSKVWTYDWDLDTLSTTLFTK